MTPRLILLIVTAFAILALGRAISGDASGAVRSPAVSEPERAVSESVALHVSSLRVPQAPSNDVPADGHAHPITAEHVQLQTELQLIGALNDALDLHDVSAMRRLITKYREHDPSDEHRLQAGYERIADCLQYPGAASRESAQRYYDQERASTLRRYVRRACFE